MVHLIGREPKFDPPGLRTRRFLVAGRPIGHDHLKPPHRQNTGEFEPCGITYALSSEICEEYALTIPGAEPALFTVCLTQQLDELADAEIYAKLRDELLAGIEIWNT